MAHEVEDFGERSTLPRSSQGKFRVGGAMVAAL